MRGELPSKCFQPEWTQAPQFPDLMESKAPVLRHQAAITCRVEVYRPLLIPVYLRTSKRDEYGETFSE